MRFVSTHMTLSLCVFKSTSETKGSLGLTASVVSETSADGFGGRRSGDADAFCVTPEELKGKAIRLFKLIFRFPVGIPTFFGGSFHPTRIRFKLQSNW